MWQNHRGGAMFPERAAELHELLEIQAREGNWNADPYMNGLYNGLELAVATLEGRAPVFRRLGLDDLPGQAPGKAG